MSQLPYINQSQLDEHIKESNAKRVGNMVWDVDNLQWVRLTGNADGSLKDPNSLPTAGNNPSLLVTDATVGTVKTTTIVETISGVDYTQTVAVDSSDDSITVSEWSTT